MLTGRIKEEESLFHYREGSTYKTYARTSFHPLFIEDVLSKMTDAEKDAAVATCGSNKECFFDLAVTGR